MSLEEAAIEWFLLERGAIKAGIAATETLAGGPPSAGITYRMEGARSAVSFTLPLDRDRIRAFLAKGGRLGHEEDNIRTNLRSRDLSWELAEMPRKEGHAAKGTAANMKCRQDEEGWQLALRPDVSHRYLAVRSGVGSYGWPGNAGIKGSGTAVILGTTVTGAELAPTDPVPEEESFCDRCKLCYKSCAVGMFDNRGEMTVTLGGATFTRAARRDCLRCDFCCRGFAGLAKSGKWSAWSPGASRFPRSARNSRRSSFGPSIFSYGARPCPAVSRTRPRKTTGST